MNIEPLESRIAPAILLPYTDVDGDAVTIAISKGDDGAVTSGFSFTNNTLGGTLISLNLNGNTFDGANITITATPKRDAGGVLRGDGHADVGFIDATGIPLGAVTIDGDLGRLDAGTGVAGSVAVKRLSILSLGARGLETSSSGLGVLVNGTLGSLKVAGSIHGTSVKTFAGGDIGAVTIGGSIIAGGGSAFDAGVIDAEGDIGPVVVKGDLVGGGNAFTGRIDAGGKLGAVTIGGSVRGGGGNESGQIFSGGDMGKVKIGGDLRGGPTGTFGGDRAGVISSGGKLAGVALGGSLLQGTNGSAQPGGRILAVSDIGTITIAGSMVASGMGTEFGADIKAQGKITSVSVGGSIVGAQKSSGAIVADTLGKVTVHGDLRGGTGDNSGRIFAEGSIGKAAILGSLVGGTGSTGDGVIRADGGSLDSVTIGVDVRDGGAILGERLPSVTVKGSVLRGSIIADQDIGSVVVKGSIAGESFDLAKIYARGLAGDPVEKNIAIRSLTVGGHVENAWILAGVNTNGTAASGNAQIGAVKVRGSWIASSLAAGVDSVDGVFGDGDDVVISGGTRGKIASIVINGAVLGRAGSTDTFGFGAPQIGSFKHGGVAVALAAGAGTDAFPGNAHAVGPSTSPGTADKPDGFAVHVFEVLS